MFVNKVVLSLNLLIVTITTSFLFNIVYAQEHPKTRLVLQITVDDLRADLLNRYRHHFGEGGFAYLMDKGVVYNNAHYQHANTETIVGHTTLATGTLPSIHGMVGNVWYDRKAGQLSYNIEDPEHPLLPVRKQRQLGEQVDPSQQLSRTQGRSPKVILAATLGDTLAAFYNGQAKIFGVSGKDRSAVAMAGHIGKAFWYSTNSGDMITSSYYYSNYPQWVKNWNQQRKAAQYAGTSWQLLNNKNRYLFAERDDRPYESDLKGYGKVFPHSFGNADDKLFYTRLLVSPIGDQLLLDFSKQLLVQEQLGQDDIPDYLSISFSAVDAVNHFFGPNSLENEDVIAQLDRILSELFTFIEQQVGLDKTLIVLSADHGIADMPEHMTELGYQVGRHESDQIVEAVNLIGKDKFGINEIVKFFFRPYLYLDEQKLAAKTLKKSVVAEALAQVLIEQDGIAFAVASKGNQKMADNPVIKQIRRNYHPSRSGDIYIEQSPYWFLFEKGPVKNMHGSPWRYDTHVPIIFAGANIQAKIIERLVHPVDVAPTIAAFLGISPPAANQGLILKEVIHH